MKRLLLTIFFIFFIPSMSLADEVDKGLPSDTSSQIKESARQVLQNGVEPEAVIKMTQRMIEDNFTEQQIVASHALLIKAKKQNIDEEPIINKLHEGIAKNVGAQNILQAMEKVRARYDLAYSYTQGLNTDEEKSRVMAEQMAECMAAGLDKNSMNKIIEMIQERTRNTGDKQAFEMGEKTLKTARTMARSGVDSEDIVDVMNNAFQQKYNPREMEKLGNTFMIQAGGSSSASALAKAYSHAIKNGATPDNIVSFMHGPGTPSGGIGSGAPPPSGGIGPGGEPPPSGGMAAGTPPSGGIGPGAPPPSGGIGPGGSPQGGNISPAGTGESGGPAIPPSGGPP